MFWINAVPLYLHNAWYKYIVCIVKYNWIKEQSWSELQLLFDWICKNKLVLNVEKGEGVSYRAKISIVIIISSVYHLKN